ncbi:MAG: hypothetical protein KJ065_25425 [Anaerolineae bacterium]|nr:hypothetical protein [Anaerolineae bacterium]
MEETQNIDLASVIVSVAKAVVEANRILSEDTEAPMGISEFTIQYQVHASLHISAAETYNKGLRQTETGVFKLEKPQIKSAQLHNLTTLTPRERILTGYLRDADLTITTKMEPLPRTE